MSNKVSASILKELERGHTAAPFDSSPLPNLHCSPLGSAPKKDGSSRIILDLSQPVGGSINDGISTEACHVKYMSFDSAVNLVNATGKGCFMGKIDIKHAFRLCPVHPDDWHLLGYSWRARWFFDMRLPFGLRSSPFIFTSFSDALQWILLTKFFITGHVHYLDDFLVVASTREKCQFWMDLIVDAFEFLGVPIAKDKFEGPSQTMVFLGIEIDSVNMVIRLPQEKQDRLNRSVEVWLSKSKCIKRELLSLIGSLSFACKVIKPGRTILRRLIDLSTSVKKLHQHISLSACICQDLAMWRQFLSEWNGISYILNPTSPNPLNLSTDASFLGFGALFLGKWISSPWPSSPVCSDGSQIHIFILEMFAIYAAIESWSESFKNQQIFIFTDNESIVSVWSSGTSKDKKLMVIVRALFFLITKLNSSFSFQHVPGKDNIYSDLLSRLQVERFKSVFPFSAENPSTVTNCTKDLWAKILSTT